eukprot:2248759-Rhodomonas_salina.1
MSFSCPHCTRRVHSHAHGSTQSEQRESVQGWERRGCAQSAALRTERSAHAWNSESVARRRGSQEGERKREGERERERERERESGVWVGGGREALSRSTERVVQADLAEASRAMESFFASVSHELRTPLTGPRTHPGSG